MSRCFPFPPPGYEKKIRTEEADALIKEKQKKEKKHKKEKKDKEKREGKEKRDKETSKDKHKEQKEKHRDGKDKDRCKEKSRTLDDKKDYGVLQNTSDREKFVRNNLQNNGNGESKFIQDLARRIRDEEDARESQSVGTEVMVQLVERKEHPKKTEVQEKNHLRESVVKSDKTLDSEGIKRNEPKYTTHRSSQEKKTGQDTSRYVENGCRPNKIHRPVTSPVSSVENGRKLGACQTPPKPVFELQGTEPNQEVKEHRINGFIDAQEVKVKENGEASTRKRPHSDLKYLDEILNVPKREELDEVGEDAEQEWLFGQSGVKLSKKPKTDSTTLLDKTLQVWNQALRIESADIVALPYVVPF